MRFVRRLRCTIRSFPRGNVLARRLLARNENAVRVRTSQHIVKFSA